MSWSFKNDAIYTPDLLKLFQSATVQTDLFRKCGEFNVNLGVLVSVCPLVRTCLLDRGFYEDEPVVILSGFSDDIVGCLKDMILTGSVNLPEPIKDEIESDFSFLGIRVSNDVPEEFDFAAQNIKTELKDEEEPIDDENFFSVKQEESKRRKTTVSNQKAEQPKMTDEDFRVERLVVYKPSKPKRKKDYKGKRTRKVTSHIAYFQCWKCPFKNKNAIDLVEHVKSKHEASLHLVTGPFTCKSCSNSFRTIGVYCRHITSTEACRPGGICETCGRNFESERMLNQHKRLDHDGKPTPCTVCGKVYPTERKMWVHRRTQHEECQCEFCSMLFPSNAKLRHHILNVHTSNDQKPFKCNICGKGFGRGQPYREHMDAHNNIKRHKCRLCDYRCTSSSNRNKHERTFHKYVHSEDNGRLGSDSEK